MTDGGKVIDSLDDIIHLDGFKCGADFICSIDLFNFVSCQAIACHTVGGICKVNLDVLVDTIVVILVSLIDYSLSKGSEIRLQNRFFLHGLVL